jgi:hypothetical protein
LHNRLRAPVTLALALALCASLLGAAPAAAVGPKVVIIVGPTGALTDTYRSMGNALADAVEALDLGVDVVKVYSPRATWAKVKAAVEGASIIVYLGHGNGFPSPYSSTEDPTKVNGWGLNRTTKNGDSDNWSTTMVYCGEEALLGKLTSVDAAQWKYCGGSAGNDGINPAPGFVMIYNGACYAPGAGETGGATQDQARERVRNFSYPVLALGAGAYFATDLGARPLVELILTKPNLAFGAIAQRGNGYDAIAQRHFAHADLAGAEVWTQKTYAMGRWDYWYAFAGDPNRTPDGGTALYPGAPRLTRVAPLDGKKGVTPAARPYVSFDRPLDGLGPTTFGLYDSFGFHVPASLQWNAALNRATLVPKRPLVTTEWYTLRLGDGLTASNGVALPADESRFRTKADAGDGVSAYWTTPRQVTLGQGTHTGYRFDADGRKSAALTLTQAADSAATTVTRRTLPRQSGYWFRVADGPWAGTWIRQSSAVHLADETQAAVPPAAAFDPAKALLIRKGTHTGYQFDPSGAMTAQKTSTVGVNTSATTSALQAITNQSGTWFLVADGKWAGYWMRASEVVALKS